MKPLFVAVLFFVGLAVGLPPARAQLSSSGDYVGRIGAAEISVGVKGNDLLVFYADRAGRYVETATGELRSDGTATLSTNYGRIVSLLVSGSSVSGRFVGAPFSASRVSVLGPIRARSYFGMTSNFGALNLRIFADGRAILMHGSDPIGGGFGTVSSTGVVTVAMASGQNWTFLLEGGSGRISTPGFGTLEYVLAELQRPSMLNVSTRGTVGGTNSLTAGFVIDRGSKTLLIRAVGPSLAAFGVSNTQSDTVLSLFSGQTVIASNNDWGADANSAEIATAARQVGAFTLLGSSRDSAMIVTLKSGAYTAQVTGAGPSGEALVEVYEIN